MRHWLPAWGLVAFTLAACGHGGGGGEGGFAVPFQVPNLTVLYSSTGTGVPSPPTSNPSTLGGPSSASATFTSGTGVTASGLAPADTAGNTVTLTTTQGGTISTIAINISAPNGGPAVSQTFTGVNQGAVTLTAPQFAALISAIAASPATTANAVYQGVVAGLSYSAYGAWMQSIGGGSYNVGMYAFGPETVTMPAGGSANYRGTTLGFGSNGTAPFTFTGTASIAANFSTNTISSLQFTGITTQDVNDANPGPALANFSGFGSITGNKYSFAVSNGTVSGTVTGMFFGPSAAETGGVWKAANVGNTLTLVGGFGAHQ